MGIVLITGAGGFLGQVAVSELSRIGYRVRALLRTPTRTRFPENVEIVVGDLRDPACAPRAVVGCDSVLHLAGKAHAPDDERVCEEEYQSINVEGTRRILDAATASGVRHFVFASSVKVFGEATQGCVDEAESPAPETPYARSKWAAEQLVASFSQAGRLAGVSVRLPLVYGPTHKGNLYRMVRAIDRGWFPPLPPLEGVRSMLHVANFVQAVRKILESDKPLRPCYIVTDARPYNVTILYDWLRAGLGKPNPRGRVPLWALSTIAGIGDVALKLTGRQAPLTHATLHKLIDPAWYRSDAIARDLGYQPQYSFQDAVPELVEFYRRTEG